MDRPVPLSYDATVLRHHRWFRRGLIIAALGVAAAFGSVWVGPLWHQSKVLYWQHRCATYKPAGQQFPKEWTEYGKLVSPPGVRSRGTVFLGELVSPAGQHDLVSVGLQIKAGSDGQPALTCVVWIVEPASWPLTPPRVHFFGPIGFNRVGVGNRPISFDSGWVDPNDRSHFHADLGTDNGVIDGWLLDKNQMKLETE